MAVVDTVRVMTARAALPAVAAAPAARYPVAPAGISVAEVAVMATVTLAGVVNRVGSADEVAAHEAGPAVAATAVVVR